MLKIGLKSEAIKKYRKCNPDKTLMECRDYAESEIIKNIDMYPKFKLSVNGGY